MIKQTNHDSTDLELRKQIDLGIAIKELSIDPRFILLIETGYFTDKANMALSDLPSSNESTVKSAQNQLLAIALFKEYIDSVTNTADSAENDIGE